MSAAREYETRHPEPSLGGFVCPFVVAQADLWKVGQLAPGDSVPLTLVCRAIDVCSERRESRHAGRCSTRLSSSPDNI